MQRQRSLFTFRLLFTFIIVSELFALRQPPLRYASDLRCSPAVQRPTRAFPCRLFVPSLSHPCAILIFNHRPDQTPLLSRRTTQRDFLFFAKKNDDHQVKSSLRDAVLPSSGVNVVRAARSPHARRAAAPCSRREHRARRERNTRILNMTRVMRRRRATTRLNERYYERGVHKLAVRVRRANVQRERDSEA